MATTISQRQLRNESGEIMRRIERGESFTVTRNGIPVADLVPHVATDTAPPRFVGVATIAAGATALPIWRAGLFADQLQDLDQAVDDGDIDRWNAAP